MPELVNVPNVDGIPAVAFAPNAGLGIALAGADAAGLPFFGSGAAEWGIFRRGSPVVVCDNVVAFDHKADWAISDYPVEGGQFESYNKVTIPYDVRLVFTAGGSEANRAALLNSLRAIVGDLNYYDAVSPEAVYTPVNLVHLDYRRTAQNGVGLITVSVWCRQVRQVKSSTAGAAGGADATGSDTPSATGSTGETAAPSGADQINSGAVQTAAPTASDITSAEGRAFANGVNVGGFDVNAPDPSFGAGEAVFTDPRSGQIVDTVPGTAAAPSTSSTISGLSPAGPDTFTSLNVGTGGLS